MPTPKLPTLSSTEEVWGPPATIPKFLKFNDVPYAPFSKGDKLGKVADWAADPKDSKDQRGKQQHRHRDPYHAYGANSASFFTNDDEESISSFSVVDSTKQPPKPKTQTAVLKSRRGGASAGGSTRGGASSRGRGGAIINVGTSARHTSNRRGWKDFDNKQKTREPSVAIANDWELLQTIGFVELQKLSFDVKSAGEDIESYGYVHHYNRGLERPGSHPKLQPLDRTVYNVSASDDPVIQKLSSEKTGAVYTTDSVLSLLMTATKSANPWDLVISKKDGQIFLDKREGGPLDFVTVDENAVDAPADFSDKETNINSAQNLGIEATYINQNFTANAVATNQKHEFGNPNPFQSSPEEPLLAQGYRYKKYNLADNPEEDSPLNLVVRTSIDSVQTTSSGEQFITVQALNEYGGSNGKLEWKNKFTNQRGAIVAAEMKNNLAKLSRWSIESILAGASMMKIGFVSRVTPKDNTNHIIVGVLGRDPKQFATQLNVNMLNGWGIVKSVVNIISAMEDGKYVLIKDPNVPQVKLYSVPENTFTSNE